MCFYSFLNLNRGEQGVQSVETSFSARSCTSSLVCQINYVRLPHLPSSSLSLQLSFSPSISLFPYLCVDICFCSSVCLLVCLRTFGARLPVHLINNAFKIQKIRNLVI